jgi:hypothetical protein
MQTLTEKQVEELFQELKENIPKRENNVRAALENIKPSQHEVNCLEWRYRLSGFAEGLSASNILELSIYEDLIASLFSARSRDPEDRPGRKHRYSVDIITEQESVFTFDVSSMNPIDAYAQLTKRIAYKAIPGITNIAVYAGLESDRLPSATPIETFEKNELVFVSLV